MGHKKEESEGDSKEFPVTFYVNFFGEMFPVSIYTKSYRLECK